MHKSPTLSPLRAWLNWSIAVGFVVLVFGFQTGYAITNSKMGLSLGLTSEEIGFVGFAYTAFFAMHQLLSGALLDRLGAYRILPIACTLLTIGVFIFAYSTSLYGLIFAQFWIALGASFGFVGAGFVGGLWFAPERYGLMFSGVQFVASLSAFLSQQVLNEVLQTLPWDWVINGIGMFGLLIVLLMFLWLRDPPHIQKEPLLFDQIPGFIVLVFQTVKQVLCIPQMMKIMFIGAASFGVMLSIGVIWGPPLFQTHGLLEIAANRTISYSWLGLAIGAPVLVGLGKKHAKQIMFLSLLLQCVIITVLLSTTIPHEGALSLLAGAWGFAAGGSMIPFALAVQHSGVAFAGTSASLVNGSQFLLGGFMMSIPGTLLTRFPEWTITYALLVIPLLLVLGMLVCLSYRPLAPTSSS